VAVLAAVGVVASVVGFSVERQQFYHSYLTAYLFSLTVSLGCLFFVLLQHLTRAGWSVAIRRVAETAASMVPVFIVLFIPVLLGRGDLYHWTHHDAVEHDLLLQHKEGYLNVTFFLIRAAAYFLIWLLISQYFHRQSVAQDTHRDPKVTVQLQRRAAPSMILFAFTLTFMAFDWVMSMDPHWYSTIFGVYVFSGTAVAGYAFLTIAITRLRGLGFLGQAVRVDHYQDLGRLMFAFSVFWAYIAFSQYFLIWYGNIPEETVWYVHRMEGSWKILSYFLAAGHFAVPFVFLMSRWTKRRPWFVTLLAMWLILVHYIDLYWLIMPNLHHEGVQWHWLDLACLLATFGIFMAVFLHRLARNTIIPVGDPRLKESMALEHLY